jgi:hypothetical protein
MGTDSDAYVLRDNAASLVPQVLPDVAKWEYMGAVPLNGKMVQLWQLKEKCDPHAPRHIYECFVCTVRSGLICRASN